MLRVGIPHLETGSCQPTAGGCQCGWQPPCPSCDYVAVSPTIRVCVVCGSSIRTRAASHPGQLPDCSPRASINQTVTVCSCGYHHPDWASMEWQAWLSERES